MIYPNNFEAKIGFYEIRQLLSKYCLSSLGTGRVEDMAFSDKAEEINESLEQVREFRRLLETKDNFPLQYFFDIRQSIARIRLEGSYLIEGEMFDLRRSLDTISQIVLFLNSHHGGADEELGVCYEFPSLQRLTVGIETFPDILQRIDLIIDKCGRIRDDASPKLSAIKKEMLQAENSVSGALNKILRAAQREGLVDKDVAPTLRDGRLVIPVAPALKRKIKGIVHDESASGKTVFVEPAEVVEANNRIRELESAMRKEIIRILVEFSAFIRPSIPSVLHSYRLLADIDFIQAKARWAMETKAMEPCVTDTSHIDWIQAIHPLLQKSLEKQGKKVVPLDIVLTADKRILIISGPNAGGKSVCLKTVGLLQYMVQCGLSVTMKENSVVGLFKNIMIDIGDEQSIENDLSTYSSHLLNMKQMMKHANEKSLLLIDEFGSGTEPLIGGAMAEAVLRQFCKRKAFGIITTHYQNLKHFADEHPLVENGAMLYDRHEMRAMFQLQIGQPGSSFAVEIARKTGLPEEVIQDASSIVGADYIQSDKYLQDIVRDKRYWENKRQAIHQREKELEKRIARYEQDIRELQESKNAILRKAKEEAEELLKESNRRIENAIREIREKQAEKEEARRIRKDLNMFKESLEKTNETGEHDLIERKMRQIMARKERKESQKKKKQEAHSSLPIAPASHSEALPRKIQTGDSVRIKGLTVIGRIESLEGNMATVIFGDMKTKMKAERLELAETLRKHDEPGAGVSAGRQTRETIDKKKLNFKQDIDVRGMRGDEALMAVTYFIDDAILVGMSRVRILHGTGSGILRQLIRDYLSTVPNVTAFRDEHVQFGGAGITVVDL